MIPVIMGMALAAIHYFSEKFEPKDPAKKHKLVSFAAGISITYIFLLLLPEVYSSTYLLQEFIFIFILAGFSIFHLIEKHIYQHESQEKLHEELKITHSSLFFFYHLIIGILLVNMVQIDILKGALFFIPIFFHTALSSASLKGIHVSVREKIIIKTTLSFSTLFGVVLAYYVSIPAYIIYALLGFVVGSLLYVVIRDSIPEETQGKAIYFALGVVIYSIIISLTWIL